MSEGSIDKSRDKSACITVGNSVPGDFERLDGDLCDFVLLERVLYPRRLVELLSLDEPRIDIAFEGLVDHYGWDL